MSPNDKKAKSGPVPIGVEMKKAYPLGEQKPGG
jgi:hypothetical protein